jgi:Conserved hypothetical protein (DUF2461)
MELDADLAYLKDQARVGAGDTNFSAGVDPETIVAALRRQEDTDMVRVRREAEDEARALLDRAAGRMSEQQVLELGALFSRDWHRGRMMHGRFAPAFVGATIQRLAARLELFNVMTARLWSRDEGDALDALDEILRNPESLRGAGRSYPTMLFYLREPKRYAFWGNATDRGLRVLTGYTGPQRSAGKEGYLSFCEAATAFARRWSLEPQEVDLILSGASREAKPPHPLREASAPTLSSEAFSFLCELREHNNGAWMDENKDRYRTTLREPFRKLVQYVADSYLRSLTRISSPTSRWVPSLPRFGSASPMRLASTTTTTGERSPDAASRRTFNCTSSRLGPHAVRYPPAVPFPSGP